MGNTVGHHNKRPTKLACPSFTLSRETQMVGQDILARGSGVITGTAATVLVHPSF